MPLACTWAVWRAAGLAADGCSRAFRYCRRRRRCCRCRCQLFMLVVEAVGVAGIDRLMPVGHAAALSFVSSAWRLLIFSFNCATS